MTGNILQSCDLNYIYDPLTGYRLHIFKHLSDHIPKQTTVLDVGCGAVGFYWSFVYAHKVEAINFIERHNKVFEEHMMRIDKLSPEQIETDFSETWDTLVQNGFIDGDNTAYEWAEHFLNKLSSHECGDVKDLQREAQYDVIILNEVLESTSDKAGALELLSHLKTLLTEKGKIVGCLLNFEEWKDELSLLASEGLAGQYNPSIDELRGHAQEAGLRITFLEKSETTMPNYPTSLFFCFEKS